MHKHVLIPTDFQMDSLNTIKKVIHDMNDEDTVAVTLLHGYFLNDSITDLLFNSRKDILKEIVPPVFFEGCELLKNKYASQLTHIKIDLFHGLNKRAFKSYVTNNQIDKVYIPAGINQKKATKRSFDITPYINDCCDDVSHVQFQEKHEESMENFSELFLNTIKIS
ncbi:hypothetical protein H9Y05_14480 [Crocinitomicaceae bacterium CZZ-1]|uniref:Uncharacterized protein n=1 Tax=Taishania pollutisoli TaxID=2766479 RepID=A0A8J6PL58_9FLAO|nr:hypothetical protein [Taishania pollutisoli]MBC9813679.1 hypothetical protein [Taishania pollutisoli]MBX2949498.1 hypothetical protein [Crocinitomicaceae bacterium]NGF74577.1 hypothetical protein [Fluviicola sp. SGL-29]